MGFRTFEKKLFVMFSTLWHTKGYFTMPRGAVAVRIPRGESFFDPKSVYFIFRKNLSIEALNARLQLRWEGVSDARDPNKVQITMMDALMSGFAMFILKLPSLFALDHLRHEKAKSKNLQTLFGVENIPSDTRMREILDEVDPAEIRPAFKDIFFELQRGKVLEDYVFLEGKLLCALDGTGYFSSDKVSCENCLVKYHKATKTYTYHHQMLGVVIVHPDMKQVIPMDPEPIIKQDGNQKNDCERNAAKRCLENIRKDHPRLGLIITEDGLASNAPHIRDLKSHGMSFILGAKPGDHKFLFEEFSLAGSRTKEVVIVKNKITHTLTYVNDLQLNESAEDVRINFLVYEELKPNGKIQRFSWVTDIEITDKNVFEIMRGGRARWKIENETFNTLKNQGYEFEHNFGHGKKNLSVVMAKLMMLAFLVDQVQLLTNKVVREIVEKAKTLRMFYWKIKAHFEVLIFEDWSQVYKTILYGAAVTFIPNTA